MEKEVKARAPAPPMDDWDGLIYWDRLMGSLPEAWRQKHGDMSVSGRL